MTDKAHKARQPSYATLKYEVDGAVATITFNRPEKRNAISSEMVKELLAGLGEVEADPALRVLILTGAGKAFCSGMDLETLQAISTQSAAENLGDSREMARLFHRIYSFPKPVIAAVNGAAIAGGCEVRLHRGSRWIHPSAGFRVAAPADRRKACA
jgi:methylglutaconyl-CoA hydratase